MKIDIDVFTNATKLLAGDKASKDLAHNALIGLYGWPQRNYETILELLKYPVSKLATTNKMREVNFDGKKVLSCGCVKGCNVGYYAQVEHIGRKCHGCKKIMRSFGHHWDYEKRLFEMACDGTLLEDWNYTIYLAYNAVMGERKRWYDPEWRLVAACHVILKLIEENPALATQKVPKFRATKFVKYEGEGELGSAWEVMSLFYRKSGNTWVHVNPAIRSVFISCISGQVEFGIGDVREIRSKLGYGYWIGEGGEEWAYAMATQLPHGLSACLSFEAALGRIPWKIGGKRIAVGTTFATPEGRINKVTVIENFKGSEGTIRVKSYIRGEWDKDKGKYIEKEVKLHVFTEEQWFWHTLNAKIE